jgi:hypothetical protein
MLHYQSFPVHRVPAAPSRDWTIAFDVAEPSFADTAESDETALFLISATNHVPLPVSPLNRDNGEPI